MSVDDAGSGVWVYRPDPIEPHVCGLPVEAVRGALWRWGLCRRLWRCRSTSCVIDPWREDSFIDPAEWRRAPWRLRMKYRRVGLTEEWNEGNRNL